MGNSGATTQEEFYDVENNFLLYNNTFKLKIPYKHFHSKAKREILPLFAFEMNINHFSNLCDNPVMVMNIVTFCIFN